VILVTVGPGGEGRNHSQHECTGHRHENQASLHLGVSSFLEADVLQRFSSTAVQTRRLAVVPTTTRKVT
jgi:hypothetical protein